MSCYPILMAGKHLAEIDGITTRCEQYKFVRGTQPGAIEVLGHLRVETTDALNARGLSTAEHRRYLKALPDRMTLSEAADAFFFKPAELRRARLVEKGADGEEFVNLRQAFEALGLDTDLLGNTDN